MKIAILYICTGSYRVFFDGFYQSSETNFLTGHDKTYFVFSDQPLDSTYANAEFVEQENLGWPGNTLDRYSVFTKIRDRLKEFDHIYFFNANCQFVEPVGEEFLGQDDEIVVVRHPGHHDREVAGLPYERDARSRACVASGEAKYYVAGGINGGPRDAYLQFIEVAREAIEADKKAGVMPVWHDESHLNRYVIDHPHRLLDPGYCYPEGWDLPFEAKILVRDKARFGGALTLRKTRRWRAPENAIVIELLGRLGNQMFQYATARAAALRCRAEVVLDTRILARSNWAYDLGRFNIKARIGDKKDLCPPKERPLKRLAWRTLAKAQGRFIREKHNQFESKVLEAKPGTELRGYWQNERYFADVEAQLREDFTFVDPPSPSNAAMMEKIASTQSVAVHLRRGDYLADVRTQGVYARCGQEYYDRAAQMIVSQLDEEPVFFVFSDDPDWARENLRLPGELVVVDINGPETAYEDMRLMASCRHNIISNSTFSWWGAWLNPSPDKIVIGPKTWYLHESLSNEYITPEGWQVVENV
ncbi:MAG: family 6 glucosyltransferase [Rhizobiaceae bacterium]